MQIHEKELIESLSSSRILTSMITPAVLISACGTLILSTSSRMGRIFDRVNVMKGEVEAIVEGKISHPEERMRHLRGQIQLQRRRATLIQKAMVSLYTATAMFIASSLAIAANVAYGSSDTVWIPTLIALVGGLFLFIASALLLYESRFNLRFVNRSIDFIEFLEEEGTKKYRGNSQMPGN
ncbi:MAG: DUF2721 domain-containing protein [Deltaproteobacteria bacterium]|nr:DUF2721 domain-containing protein [Deltaproteobacteria bacterium]